MNTVEILPEKLPLDENTSRIFREVRSEQLPDAANRLQRIVEESYAASGIKTRTGKVLSWQQKHVSKGYAAVRPKDRPTGPNGPGAITNYLESGHRTRRPSGKAKRYTPHINVGRVPAFRFYKSAQAGAERLAVEVGESIANEIAARLEAQA